MSKTTESCGGCRMCGLADGVEQRLAGGADESVHGLALLARAAAAFVLPVLAALLGAWLAGEGESRRCVGILVGLAVGLVLSAAGSALARRWRHRPAAGLSKELE